MRPTPLVRALLGLFRAALVLLPAELRRQHGAEMADLFRERLGEEGGSAPAWRLLARAGRSFADLAVEIVASRLWAPGGRDTESTTHREGWTMLVTDIRLGFRTLRRAPVYAVATLATFAFAVGAVSAVYSAVKGLLLDPLPFPDAGRLVFIGEMGLQPEPEAHVTSRYVLDRVAAEVPDLEDVAVFNIWEATLTGVGDPKRLSGAVVTAPYFETLGRTPLVGRTFRPEDDVDGAPLRVVISHRLWAARFGSDPGAVGRTVQLSGQGYEIVGVMPADFETPDEYTFSSSRRNPPDVWRTFGGPNTQLNPGFRSFRGVARLAPETSLDRARAQVEALGARIGQEFPQWAESSRIALLPLQDQFTARARPTLMLLLAGVGFVLAAACVNVMGLALARGLDRAGDLRVRAALGAGRSWLVRQMVTETVVLGSLGGAAGLVIAALGVDALLAAAPPDLPRIETIRLHPGTALLVSLVTVILAGVAGLLPSLRLLGGRGSLSGSWSSRGQTRDRVQRRTLEAFSLVQVALAVVLLTGTGLLVRSFVRLTSVDPGYDPTGVVVAQLDLPGTRYAAVADRRRALEDILRRVREDPGVEGAGLVTSVPQHGLNNFSFGLDIVGLPRDSAQAQPWAAYRGVSPGYAEAMGLRVLQGRMIGPADWSDTPDGDPQLAGVAVNEEFVRRWLPPGKSAMEVAVDLAGMAGPADVPIVGVVKDVKYGSPWESDEPEIYMPVTGRFSTVFLVVKARGEIQGLPARMKTDVQSVDPLVPMDDVFLQERLLASASGEARTTLALMGALALFALVLGAVGLYGVVAHGVARRTREFGIRMAVGAADRSVLAGVLGQGVRLAALGAVLGLLGAWFGARFLQGLLYDVTARDPLTFAGAALSVLVIAVLATWIPARRAMRIDPVEALRSE